MTQPATDDTESQQLVAKVTAYVQQYMSQYDGSHDYAHIERVLSLAHHIASTTTTSSSPARHQPYDALTITLSALLHDVGDKKYLPPDTDGLTLVHHVLLGFGAPAALAARVQAIVNAVSYSAEMRDPLAVREVMARWLEAAVVQDADRLDALGAVGIGRAFTYGGAKGGRGMEETMDHFEEKLLRLEGLMKTEVGKSMARERTERLRVFREWWDREQGFARGS